MSTFEEVGISGTVDAVTSANGLVSEDNSSSTPLTASGRFTGEWQDTLNYNVIIIGVIADTDSIPNGLEVQWSADGELVTQNDIFSIYSDTGKVFTFSPANRYVRVLYSNGSIAQDLLNIQTILKKAGFKASSHKVEDPIVGEDDAELVINVNKAKSALSEEYETITSYRETLNVNQAWVHRKIVNETFHQHTGTITNPSIAVTAGDISITFASVTGFAVGGEIKLTEDSLQELGLMTITDITSNLVTLDRPISADYTTSAEIEEVTTNMAVSGTLASPEIFEIDPPVGVVWQFTRIMISITDASSMDDGLFGGVAALTNGVALRATTAAGRTVVFGNWKTNGDMKLDMFDVDYADKAPAGLYGLAGRWTFTKSEIVAELDGNASPLQKLEMLIQDDLTGLVTFKVRGQGRVFSP